MPEPPSRPYLLFILCFLSVALGAMDSVLSSAYLPDIARDLAGTADDATTGKIGSWTSFAFLVGGTLGGISLGFLSDRIGRRAVLVMALLSCGWGSGLGAIAGNWEVVAATRVFIGIGVGATLVISAVVVSEVWEEKTRAVALGILSVAYPVGVIASGIVTSNIEHWRAAFGLGASAMLLAWPVSRVLQASPRQTEQYADSRPANLSYHQNELILGILVYGAMLIGLWATFSWLPTWVQSLLGEGSPEGQELRGFSVALLGMGGLLGGVVSGFLANRFGARQVQAACFVICLLLSYFLFQTNTVVALPVLGGIGLLGLCFGVSQGVLNTYVPELFPPAVRSSATGLCFHVGRAFTAAAVWFVGAFVGWFGGYGNAIFAFSTVYVIGLFALFFLKKSILLEGNSTRAPA